jgi:beta-barrel assembly-enhancing protease
MGHPSKPLKRNPLANRLATSNTQASFPASRSSSPKISMRDLLVLLLFLLLRVPILTAAPSPQSPSLPCTDKIDAAIKPHMLTSGLTDFPVGQEPQLGRQLSKEIEEFVRILNDKEANEYIDRLAQTLAKNAGYGYPITATIIDSNTVNGFIVRGGFIYINKGLILKAETEAQLAGVLTYAIAHSGFRSGPKSGASSEFMQVASPWSQMFMPFGWTLLGSYQSLALTIPVAFSSEYANLIFAADCLGIHDLYRAGYDLDSYLQFLEGVSAIPRPLGVPLRNSSKYFPSISVRLDYLRAEVASLPPRIGIPIVSTSDFDAFHEHVVLLRFKTSPSTRSASPNPAATLPH